MKAGFVQFKPVLNDVEGNLERVLGFIRDNRDADLLVFPTYHHEGMPMVLFHSLACGLPIITTRIRAAADWLEEGKHCLFVPPREPQKVAEAVIHLLDHPGLRAEMSRNGMELAREFERSVVTRDFVSLYRSLVGNR